MNAKKLIDDSSRKNGLGGPTSSREDDDLKPDYDAWKGLVESTQPGFAQIALALLQRPLSDVMAVLAQLGLIALAFSVVKYGGGGMPSPQPLICVLFLAAMLGAPALRHLYTWTDRSPDHGETHRGKEDPTESRFK